MGEQQNIQITSDENTTTTMTTTRRNITIEEDDLKLSLSLRPINNSSTSSSSKNLPETPSNNLHILSKRDAQALRRHEAKLKRDFKRKASSSATSLNNDVVFVVSSSNHHHRHQEAAVEDEEEEDFLERHRKASNFGFQGAAPPWLGWNAGGYNGGFRPYQGQNGNFGSLTEGKDGVSVVSGSSSEIFENYQSISGPGGNSSDTCSHSSHPQSQLPPQSVPTSSTTMQFQACSSQLDPQPNGCNSNPLQPQMCSSYTNKVELVAGSRTPSKSPERATSSNTSCQQNGAGTNHNNTLSDNDPNITRHSSSPKKTKGENGKPPKPVGLMDQQKLLFSQMPCVSTTGNGPEGKTVTGFLYKYTKAQVSIICVCHGASFSPAGFVEHAGGVDIEYPLKYIRVVPFGLG